MKKSVTVDLQSALSIATLVACIAVAPWDSLAANGDCGQPLTVGAQPVATDCLFILRAAVGIEACDPVCVCDLNASQGAPTASDALACLQASVGSPGLLNCPCGGIACDVLAPSEAAVEAAVEQALVGLADPWNDADDFREMVERIETNLDCSLGWLEDTPPASSSVANMLPDELAAYDPNVRYCGKGTSAETFSLTVPAGECLNRTCFAHDRCYFDQCVRPECSWAAQAAGCDNPMLDRCKTLAPFGGCRGDATWGVTDVALCKVASALTEAQSINTACQEPACEGQRCDPDTGMCEDTTTTTTAPSTTSTTVMTPETTVTTTPATTMPATTTTTMPGSDAIAVVPPFACVAPGESLQLEALVEGVPEPTVTWTHDIGFGSVSTTGLYRAPQLGPTDDVVSATAVEAPGVYDWANLHVSECNCEWLATISGATSWRGGGWNSTYFAGPGAIQFLFQQETGPNNEMRAGNVGGGVSGEVPQPGETGTFRAGFTFVSPSGLMWHGDPIGDGPRVNLIVEEHTTTSMRGSLTGVAGRLDEQGNVIDTVNVSIPFKATLFDGVFRCR